MEQFINRLSLLLWFASSAIVIGGAFTYGIITVCRWLDWRPINTTTTVNVIRTARLVQQEDDGDGN